MGLGTCKTACFHALIPDATWKWSLLKGKTTGTSKKQQAQSWRGLMSLSLFQVDLWKQCLLEAPFCRHPKAQKSEGCFLPFFAVYACSPGLRQGRKRRPTTFTNQSEAPGGFEAAGSELRLSQRHFHSAPAA